MKQETLFKSKLNLNFVFTGESFPVTEGVADVLCS